MPPLLTGLRGRFGFASRLLARFPGRLLAPTSTGHLPTYIRFQKFSTSSPGTPSSNEGSGPLTSSVSVSGSSVSGTAKPRSMLRIGAELSKARLSSLVVFTSGAGYLMAGVPASWPCLAAATIGTAFAAAAAGTFNQVWEASLDARMKRTQSRPLPAGLVSPTSATAFALSLTAASAATLIAGTNPITVALGMGNIALYALVYTPLKTRSELSTAVGAVVGAIPPVMGWAAATGGELLAAEPLILGLALFWWQFPHFYSLGWTLRRDYGRGGYAMVPATDPTGHRTAWLSLRSAVALAMLPFAAVAAGVASPMFAVEGVVLNGAMLAAAWRFYASPSDATARSVFKTSLWYLPVLLILLVFHSRHWAEQEQVLLSDSSADAALMTHEVEPQLAEAQGSSDAEGAPEADVEAVGGEGASDRLRRRIVSATDSVRHVGRTLCVHETVKETKVVTAAAATAAQTIPAAASACPVPGPILTGTAFLVGGRPPSAAPAAASAEQVMAARAQVRGQCPIVSAELSAISAAESTASVAAAVVESQPLPAIESVANL